MSESIDIVGVGHSDVVGTALGTGSQTQRNRRKVLHHQAVEVTAASPQENCSTPA
jgi:hypothetical protein